jgi:hypothetical protein
MATLTHPQVIECFHLAFLGTLPSHLPRDAYVLKGGANLRYFYGSFRYSEDIDFDALMDEGWRLEEKVDAALASASLKLTLRRSGVSVASVSSQAKQTETTQRWKLKLEASGHQTPMSTKIEFSRRNGDTRWELGSVPESVVEPYALRPPTLLRYLPPAAIEQKIKALALRSQTQARDVFDLELLFRDNPHAVNLGDVDVATLNTAIARCLEIEFEVFQGQVIPFLDVEIAEPYDSPESWEAMQLYVVDKLEKLR